jgi:hypothetical protein
MPKNKKDEISNIKSKKKSKVVKNYVKIDENKKNQLLKILENKNNNNNNELDKNKKSYSRSYNVNNYVHLSQRKACVKMGISRSKLRIFWDKNTNRKWPYTKIQKLNSDIGKLMILIDRYENLLTSKKKLKCNEIDEINKEIQNLKNKLKYFNLKLKKEKNFKEPLIITIK